MTVVLAPSSLSAEASSTNASARRISAPGSRDDSCAPMNAPGIEPTSSAAVTDSSRSPKKMWPSAAEATSGTACTRSVPTSSLARSVGYSHISAMMINEPLPTEVMPTTTPPTTPMTTVGSRRTTISGGPCGSASRRPSRCRARSARRR